MPTRTRRLSASLHYLPIGVAASVLHALMLIPGYSDDGFDAGEWVTMLVLSLVLAAAVFVLVVPGGGVRSALVLGVLALLATVAFWAFFALPLAAAAIVVGLRARREHPGDTRGTIAIGLGALAVVATIAITIGDAIAN